MIDGCSVHFSHSVNHDGKTLIPSRCKVRAGSVSQMMAEMVDTGRRKTRKMALHFTKQCGSGKYGVVHVGGNGVQTPKAFVGGVIECVHQRINLIDSQALLSQTVVDCPDRESARLFFTRESLLCRCRDYFAIAD